MNINKTKLMIRIISICLVAISCVVLYMLYNVALMFTGITDVFIYVNGYVAKITGGNEFASGLLLTGIATTATYVSRNIPSRIYSFLYKHLTTILYLDSTDDAYHKLMEIFQQGGLSDLSRYIRFSNGRWGGEKTYKEISYGSQWFIYGNIPLHITHSRENESHSYDIKKYLTITVIGRSHNFFERLIGELDQKDQEDKTKYYKWKGGKSYITKQPKQKIDNVILSESNKVKLLRCIDTFVNKEEWYIDYNIPYQLGILLYGPPGTGKTSLVRAIAAYLDKDIIYTSSISAFAEASQQSTGCIVVVEEIDTLGIDSRSESFEGEEQEMEKPSKEEIKKMVEEDSEDEDSDTLSIMEKMNVGTLLTALDGIISNHGRIVIITTNHKDKLDPALKRPGRIDLELELGYMTPVMLEDFLNKFFEDVPSIKSIKEAISPADVQKDIILGVSLEEIIEKYSKEVE